MKIRNNPIKMRLTALLGKAGIKRIFRRMKGRFFSPREINEYIKYNKRVWKPLTIENPKTLILLDSFWIPEWVIATSYFVNVLAGLKKSRIVTFSKINHGYVSGKVRKSYNVSGHVTVKLNSARLKKLRDHYVQEFFDKVRRKKDVYDYQAEGYWIGIDIYETYLRSGKPTIELNDPEFRQVVKEGMEYLVFWRDYLRNRRVAGVVLSDTCYTLHNILAKVAYRLNVPVYLPNARGLHRSDKPFSVYKYRFGNYRKMFDKLPRSERQHAFQWAKNRLQKRLNGSVGVDMNYSTASAFTSSHQNSQKVLRESSHLKVLITTHCFFDNPHGYGGMLFLDFYEWLHFLGTISEKTNYDWYIKPHPDYLPGTLENINDIIAEYPKIKLIPPETSFHQLAREGLSFVLTCFGSVGHEMPLLGIKVINAAYNPHSAYDFNWDPKTIEEYENLLLNLPKLEKQVDPNQIYEFYYMHYNYAYLDDLIYTSHRKALKELSTEEQRGPKAYRYFLDQITEKKHQEIISKITRFIESGKPNYFINGPE